jgi:hypothetical protein
VRENTRERISRFLIMIEWACYVCLSGNIEDYPWSFCCVALVGIVGRGSINPKIVGESSFTKFLVLV